MTAETDNNDETAASESNSEEEKPAAKKPMSKSRRRWIIVIGAIIIIAGLAIGIPYYLYATSHESSDDAFVEAHIVTISPRVSSHVDQVLVIENQWVNAGDLIVELDPKDFQARLDAARASLNAARSTFQSKNINVELTRISSVSDLHSARADVKLSEATVDHALARVDAANSQCSQASAKLEYARAALSQARAELNAATARHGLDAKDLKRAREMGNTISRQQLDRAVATERISAANRESVKKRVKARESMVTEAEAALKTAQDNLRQAEAQAKVAAAQLEQARARLTAAEAAPKKVEQSRSQKKVSMADIEKAAADVEQAQLSLSYTKIYAPCDGHITKKSVEPGNYVATGQALMSIVKPGVWVRANFKETQLTDMRPGQPAAISIDAYPDVTFTAHVQSIQRGTGAQFSLLPPENATGNYVKVVQRVPVKIVFDDFSQTQKYLLAPGMSAVPVVNISAKGWPRQSNFAPSSPNRESGADGDAVP